MKYIKTYDDKIFHCYIPYSNEKLFTMATSKLNIDKHIKDDIILYLRNTKYFEEYSIGCFLRFYLPEWDFFPISYEKEIHKVSKLLEDSSYNTDNMTSMLPKGKSKYIGQIEVSKDDIEFYDTVNKYNL